MNILPYQVHNILKIYREPAGEEMQTGQRAALKERAAITTDRVEISDEGRKAQIKREIVSEIVRKIR